MPEELLLWIDAMNIDLKDFREKYYRKLGGDLDTVKTFIAGAVKSCHDGTGDTDRTGRKRFY